MNTVLRITKPLILSRETLTIRNIVKLQFRRELFNKYLSGASNVNATHNQLEYMSNCYSQKLIRDGIINTHEEPYMRWLTNDLLQERDYSYKQEVLEEMNEDRRVSIRQLKQHKKVEEENQKQYQGYKDIRKLAEAQSQFGKIKDGTLEFKVNKHQLLLDINSDIKELENINSIQSHTTRNIRRNYSDEWNLTTVKEITRQMLYLSFEQYTLYDCFELEDIILRTEFTDKQRDVLYRHMNHMSVGDDHKNLNCAFKSILRNIKNYKATMKLDVRAENEYLLR